ncbi:hypothetical protein DE146DRAFT_616588 [Phaeosphaeria sp. MPI-PUGE-AT-0046c]|nr:hypothetical protein DE146DRAFT_616588 [Phaeosphaeria sp. MPI-PUGE-AT-0046c]
MPDNKTASWRKKISSKPKELQLPTPSLEDGTSTESGRHRGWRKTIHVSRPNTPTAGPPATPTLDETETQSERLSCSTPRRDSKPKLTRYTSLFGGFKDASKGPDFDTPWNDNPPTYEPYMDPKLAIQSIRSHMVHFSMKPIPLEHSNNLFRIFEHYRRLCEENGRLDTELQRTRQHLKHAELSWAQEEQSYADEIRRLELLISKGVSGVAGVLHARQGSMVDRKRMRRTATSIQKMSTVYGSLTQDQLIAEIKARSQKVLLQRPCSPSGRMTALSRRLVRASTDLHIKSPPDQSQKNSTLARKVQSELNLTRLDRVNTAQSVANSSVGSAFSGTNGDMLPDEVPSSQGLSELSVDCDAIIALREASRDLGALVARRRGLNVNTFVNGVMTLLFEDSDSDGQVHDIKASLSKQTSTNRRTCFPPRSNGYITPKQTLQIFQSQPELNSDQKRRRHFSFEPGEDHLQALKGELIAIEHPQLSSHLAAGTSSLSCDSASTRAPSTPNSLVPSHDTSDLESHSASKIPSPLQAFGNVRRETSIASLKSTMTRSNDGRHDSRSSILTAYRDDQNSKLRPASSSRSSSCTTSHGARIPPSTKDRSRGIRCLDSVDQQSTEYKNHTKMPRGGSSAESNAETSTADVAPLATYTMGALGFDKDKSSGRG